MEELSELLELPEEKVLDVSDVYVVELVSVVDDSLVWLVVVESVEEVEESVVERVVDPTVVELSVVVDSSRVDESVELLKVELAADVLLSVVVLGREELDPALVEL